MKYQDFVEQAIFQAIGMNASGYFALNKLPEKTAIGYVEEGEGWRTNIYNLPIIGASDGGAFTTVADIATLWQAFWRNEIIPKELVETYAQPYIKTGAKRKNISYGHGLWMSEDTHGNRHEYITGSDAGISFRSSVHRSIELQITVVSNTSHGVWPIWREIAATLEHDTAR